MRIFLVIAAFVLMSAMLAEPVLASNGKVFLGNSDITLVALGLAGVMLGRRGGYRIDED